MEFHDIVQEAVMKTIPKKKNGSLGRSYKKLRKQEKLKGREKGKIFECRVQKNSKER